MNDTRHIKISEFDYPLPDERIAKFPLPVRDQSKLLVYRHGEVSRDVFTSLLLFAKRKPDDIQQYKSDSGTITFPQRDGRADRSILSGTGSTQRLCTRFPTNTEMQLALHDRQPEEMERRGSLQRN